MKNNTITIILSCIIITHVSLAARPNIGSSGNRGSNFGGGETTQTGSGKLNSGNFKNSSNSSSNKAAAGLGHHNEQNQNSGSSAAMGAMAAGNQDSDDSGDSTGSTEPTNSSSTTPTNQQSTPDQSNPTTPSTTPVQDNLLATNNAQSSNSTEKLDDKDAENKNTDTSENSNNDTIEEKTIEDKKTLVSDENEILEKLKNLDLHDQQVHMLLTHDSMNQLFNNFVYFKDFLVKNFKKEQIVKLAVEFINQIYPQQYAPIIKINEHTIHQETAKDEHNKIMEHTTQEDQSQKSETKPIESNQNNQTKQEEDETQNSSQEIEQPDQSPQEAVENEENHENENNQEEN